MTGADEELSYEQARTELAAVVERLEAGGCTLEESLALWERGEHLAAVCQRWLDGARERISRQAPDRAGTDRAVDGGPPPGERPPAGGPEAR